MPELVSVIVTTYNHERYIAAAIQSVLDQTYRDYEVIVVDDGSTDSTGDRVLAFRHSIQLVRQENQGVAASRNTGIRHARGHFLAFLDGDDLWEPDKLTHQVAAARSYPRSGLIAVNGVHFSGDTILHNSLFPPPVTTLLGSSASDSVTLNCYERLLERNLIPTTSQVLIPRAVLEQVGLSDPRLPLASDWDLYIRIAASFEFTFVRTSLVRWRYLETSASGSEQLRPLRWAKDHIDILRKHRRSAPVEYRSLIRTLLKQKLRETAEQTYQYGRQSNAAWARRHLLALLRQNRFSPVTAVFLVALCLPRPFVHLAGRAVRAAIRRRSRTQQSEHHSQPR
jgi:glycosyltransferase involved in cell wall biosynthesis